MAKFYVGQRVRVVSASDNIGNGVVGMCAVVNEVDVENWNGDKGLVGVTVAGEEDWCFWSHQLEPLIPPHEACDYLFKLELDEILARVGESV